MKKILLLIFSLCIIKSNAQYFQLTYHVAGCAGNPLIGASGIYLYAGAGTQNATSTYDYTAGGFNGTDLALQYIGNNDWVICFDPYQVFKDANQNLLPTGTTIYNFEINFRDSSGTIFTGQCGSGSYIKIDNPMTSPQTLFPNLVNGQPVVTCSVGFKEIKHNDVSVSVSPNPMNQSGAMFQFNLPQKENVTLQLFNMLGNKVCPLIDSKPLSGLQQVYFNGDDLRDGCYYYLLRVGESQRPNTGKLIISR